MPVTNKQPWSRGTHSHTASQHRPVDSMLRRIWKPLTATVVVGAPAYIAYKSYYIPESFDLPVRTRNLEGKVETITKHFSLLPLKDIEPRLHENAISETTTRPNGITWKYTTSNLSSNDPIEDAHDNQIVERDPGDPSAPGDYLFFAVMDGHGGPETSKLLSRILIKGIAMELSNLLSSPTAPSLGLMNRFKSLFSSPPQQIVDNDPKKVSRAIEEGFTKLDDELIHTPLRVLANNMDQADFKTKTVPDLSKHPLALTVMRPAVAGSCALLSIFDTAHRNLYVACSGDSRAIAGVWEPSEDGEGQWRIEVLTEDQTGRNPSELARMRSEHPLDEADSVIREGRVLGGLEPTRSFGDARYKWPLAVQETLNDAFLVGNNMPMRPQRPNFKTPPYVTARPVVTHWKMPPLSNDSPGSTRKSQHFLVLATDGLWDELSNEEVVGLVAGHLTGLKGTIPKSELPNIVRTSQGLQGVNGKRLPSGGQLDGSWIFKDENLSTHLIRNACNGGDEKLFRKRLSIPAPFSRRHRDDMTVTVICWEEGQERKPDIQTEKTRSKL